MKRSWLARHPVGFMALYTIFYLSVFHYLESNVPLRSILVHCRLDDLIPFCKYAVIPYFAWFVWIPFTLFYLLWKAPREDFWRLCLPLFSGMTIALACYAVLPTALDLRPYWVPGSDIFAQTVRFLYRTDTATNVCPSIHVFNSVTLLLAYYRSHIFDAPRRRWMRPAAAGCVPPPLCCAFPSSAPPCCSSSTAASMWPWVRCWHWRWTAPLPPPSAASCPRCGEHKEERKSDSCQRLWRWQGSFFHFLF